MDAAVRIRPTVDELTVGAETFPVASVFLGGVPRGAVVLLCSPGGLSGDAVEGMNGLAEHGYESVAADLTVPSDGGTDTSLLPKIEALLGLLEARGWVREQIGVVGYDFGGRGALLAALEFGLGAAVSIDAVAAHDLADSDLSRLRTPWLGMFGDLDDRTPTIRMAHLARALWSQSPVYTEIVGYPGVSGSFYRNPTESLTHAAAFDSWQRVIEWLNAMVVPRPTPLAEAWRARQLVG